MALEAVLSPSTALGQYNSTPPTFTSGNPSILQTDANGNLKTIASGVAPVGGGITWGAPTAVAMTGSSKNLIAANAARKALMIINPVGNAQVSYDLSGGTVTLVGGIPLLAGAVDTYTGAECPVGAVTIIGTNAQNAVYVEGT